MGKTNETSTSNIVDLSLDAVRKKRFRIDNDDTRILELNTSDLNILVRLREAYPKLVALAEEAFKNLPEVENSSDDYDFLNDEATNTVINTLRDADTNMRQLIDYIFDSNVSDICVPSGSMYDPINGQFRFEHIINILAGLYEQDVSAEMNKISKRVQKHTDKYTKR